MSIPRQLTWDYLTFAEMTSLIPFIAPFWADFNFRDSGTIFYRVTSDSIMLDMVAEAIASENSLYEAFRPTMAVFVTWFQSKLLTSDKVVS